MGVEKLQDQRVKEKPSGVKKEQGKRLTVSAASVKNLRRGGMRAPSRSNPLPGKPVAATDASVKNLRRGDMRVPKPDNR